VAQKFLTPITLLNSASDPASAEKGDIYFNTTLNTPKVYTGTAWVPVSSGGATVSDTAPSLPGSGSIWFNSTNGQTYVYYDGFWVEISTSLIGPQGPAGADGAPGQAPWTFIGAYNNGADYTYGDAVTYEGGFYYRTGNPKQPWVPTNSWCNKRFLDSSCRQEVLLGQT